MAILCDKCRKEDVQVNGDVCEQCIKNEKHIHINQRQGVSQTVYLPDDLFNKLKTLKEKVEVDEKGSKKLLSKFMKVLKTGFIDKTSGKEINDPTPQVIIPKHSTIDRIQKILNHNINVYAQQNQLETLESMEDWSIDDIHSDEFEQSIYQYVDNITLMAEEAPAIPSEEELEETPSQATADVKPPDDDPPLIPS